MNNKTEPTYKTIGEVTKSLNLIDKKTGKAQTHTIRYWEKQFRQIKPVIMAGNRRYYSQKNINTIKLIMNLLKNQGMTIKGVKKILENKKNIKIHNFLFQRRIYMFSKNCWNLKNNICLNIQKTNAKK